MDKAAMKDMDMAETQQMLAEMQVQFEELPKELAAMLKERDKLTDEDVRVLVVGISGISKMLRKAADELDKGIEGLS